MCLLQDSGPYYADSGGGRPCRLKKLQNLLEEPFYHATSQDGVGDGVAGGTQPSPLVDMCLLARVYHDLKSGR